MEAEKRVQRRQARGKVLVPVHISLPLELKERAKAAAERDGVSLSEFVRRALERYLW